MLFEKALRPFFFRLCSRANIDAQVMQRKSTQNGIALSPELRNGQSRINNDRWIHLISVESTVFSAHSMRHLVGDNEGIAEEAISTPVRVDETHSEIGDEVDSSPREIVNIGSWIEDRERKREKFFSVELFPSKRDDKEVYERFFAEVNRHSSPLFYALTWHDNGPTNRNYLPVEILRDFPNNTLLHVAAKKLREAEVVRILDDVIAQGKTNIFVLRGDGCADGGDFAHAADLVRFVRKRYNSKFNICVAGYPQMHPESTSREMDLTHLKEKVDAGADFIITQIFFESEVFINFVKNCRSLGITVPIIPGIFPIPNYKSLQRMAELCSVKIPHGLMEDLQPMRDDDDAVRAYGIALARKLIKEIFESGAACGFHLFTLNRASVALDVCRKLFK